jgi:hypothetical protein
MRWVGVFIAAGSVAASFALLPSVSAAPLPPEPSNQQRRQNPGEARGQRTAGLNVGGDTVGAGAGLTDEAAPTSAPPKPIASGPPARPVRCTYWDGGTQGERLPTALVPGVAYAHELPVGTNVYKQCGYTDGPGGFEEFSTTQVPWPGFDVPAAPAPAPRNWTQDQLDLVAAKLPTPAVTLSPPAPQALLVGMTLWLHIENFAPITLPRAQTPDGQVWVEVSATPVAATWTFDAPAENPTGVVTKACADAGTLFHPGLKNGDPGCGVTFWRQTGSHTGQVQLSWTVTATSSEGPFIPTTTTTTTAFDYTVREAQAVING